MNTVYSEQPNLGSSSLMPPEPNQVSSSMPAPSGHAGHEQHSRFSHGGTEPQRIWRIGTYSMGITLIGIGLAFAASLWQTATAYELLLWLAPIVFIVLGLEMMVAHSSKFMQKYKVAYNWLGVFFVGCVGAGALVLAAFLSSGLLEEVNQMFHLKERSLYIEESAPIHDAVIEKVVIKSELSYELQKQTDTNEISLLGYLNYEAKEPVKLSEQQLLMTKQVGSVLYIFIKNLEYDKNMLTHSYVHGQLVLNVPAHLEIVSGH